MSIQIPNLGRGSFSLALLVLRRVPEDPLDARMSGAPGCFDCDAAMSLDDLHPPRRFCAMTPQLLRAHGERQSGPTELSHRFNLSVFAALSQCCALPADSVEKLDRAFDWNIGLAPFQCSPFRLGHRLIGFLNRSARADGRWAELGHFPEVLGDGGECEFVFRAQRPPQAQTAEAQYLFQMCEKHFDLLASL